MQRRPLRKLHGPTAFLALLALAALLPATARAANFTVQARPNLSFSPANLVISPGDTVTWVNTGGVHNVVANNGSFRCANGCDGEGGNGNPAAGWTFTRTFTQPGTIAYRCEPHAAFMTGTITVQGGGGGVPGSLRFANTTFQIGEGNGSATITVQRVGGDDGQVSVTYGTANGTATAGSDYTAVNGVLTWPDGDDTARTFMVPILEDTQDEPNQTVLLSLTNATGGATLGNPSTATLTIVDNDEVEQNPGTLAFTAAAYEANEGAGSAAISVQRTGGSDNAVTVDYATADGTAVAGSDYTATTGTLSWGDGDAAAKSFNVPILDDLDTESTETVNLALSDPTGGATLGSSAAVLSLTDDDTTFPACVSDEDTLCLNQGGRFQVEVTFRDPFGNTGQGQAVTIGRRDSGLFYFFDENNIEMLVKVLNACPLPAFQSYWVFYAATTNVEFTLTVTDTVGNQQKQYFNPLNNPADPVQDTRAFQTCP